MLVVAALALWSSMKLSFGSSWVSLAASGRREAAGAVLSTTAAAWLGSAETAVAMEEMGPPRLVPPGQREIRSQFSDDSILIPEKWMVKFEPVPDMPLQANSVSSDFADDGLVDLHIIKRPAAGLLEVGGVPPREFDTICNKWEDIVARKANATESTVVKWLMQTNKESTGGGAKSWQKAFRNAQYIVSDVKVENSKAVSVLTFHGKYEDPSGTVPNQLVSGKAYLRKGNIRAAIIAYKDGQDGKLMDSVVESFKTVVGTVNSFGVVGAAPANR